MGMTEAATYWTKSAKGTIFGPAKYLPKHRRKWRAMNDREFKNYQLKFIQSKGFNVDGCTGTLSGRISPVRRGTNDWELSEIAAESAIDDFNEKPENKNTPLEYVALLKANIQPVGGIMHYLTIKASSGENRELATYRAKVWFSLSRGLLLESFNKCECDMNTGVAIGEKLEKEKPKVIPLQVRTRSQSGSSKNTEEIIDKSSSLKQKRALKRIATPEATSRSVNKRRSCRIMEMQLLLKNSIVL